MKITDLSGVLRGIDPLKDRRTEGTTDRTPAKATQSADGDSLDLSLSARASVSSASHTAPIEEPLAPDHLAAIRARIADGYYSSPAVESEIADRVLGFYAR